jgi:Ni2+-binding GTPase involved in maturation of urease and hydrogenase
MKTRLIFVGGFLGAGKTTLLLRSAQELEKQGHRVAVVTNDQGHELVDTMLASNQGAAGEVVGGCFCCRFHDLVETIEKLSETIQPDIILAEPVGSCTDIVATVLKPLERDYPDHYEVAPFTVMVDPTRDLSAFPDSLDDLFRWQIEEADMVILNKADLFSEDEHNQHRQRFQGMFPGKRFISLSALTGDGVAEWLSETMLRGPQLRSVVPVDYIIYAEAEACLGWLNATLQLESDAPFALRQWLDDYLLALREHLVSADAAIAHVKSHAHANDVLLKASLTGNQSQVTWDRLSDQTTDKATVLVNARVRCEPHVLEDAVRAASESVSDNLGITAQFSHIECFSPAPPEPVFRLA